MTATELKAEIDRRRAAIEALLLPAQREVEALERQYRDVASREFIAAHGITADMVQSSREGGWHNTIFAFGDWMRAKGCTKPWCEWNGLIYPSVEVMAGVFRHSEARGKVEHLEGWK